MQISNTLNNTALQISNKKRKYHEFSENTNSTLASEAEDEMINDL